MTRTKSACNVGTLLRRELRRQYPLCILSFVAFLAAMPGQLMVQLQMLQQMDFRDWDQSSRLEYIHQVILDALYSNQILGYVLAVLAVLAATAVFHYLHVQKQTDFYHALPVRREKLFCSRILTGLLAVIPAYLVNLILMYVVGCMYGRSDYFSGRILAVKILVDLGFFLIVFAISVLAAMLCGSTVAALTVNAVLQIGALALWECVLICERLFYPAYLQAERYWEMQWLSPILYRGNVLNNWFYYFYNNTKDVAEAIQRGEYYSEGLLKIHAAYIAAAVVLLFLSLLLYRRRRSERTGTAMVFRGLRLPLKYLTMAASGLLFGNLLFAITDFEPILYCGMAVGVLLAAMIVECLFDLSFRAMFSHQLSLWSFVVLAVAAVGAMRLDVTQYNTTLPSRGDIVSANVYSYYEELSTAMPAAYLAQMEGNAETESVGNQWEKQKVLLYPLSDQENIDEIYAMAQRGVQTMRENRSRIEGNMEYDIAFTLKDGSTFVRSYYLSGDEKSEEHNVLMQRAADVRFSEEYQEHRTDAAVVSPDNVGTLVVENSSQADQDGDLITDSVAIQEILTAVKEESSMLTRDYMLEHPAVLALHTIPKTTEVDEDNLPEEFFWLNSGEAGEYDIPVYACQKKTVKLLQEQGIRVARFDESQITSVQLYYDSTKNVSSYGEVLSLASSPQSESSAVVQNKDISDVLGGAVAVSILRCCDPIVEQTAVSEAYSGCVYTGEQYSCIAFYYMKNMVPQKTQNYSYAR
ncbi:MAG: hypothetical protein ACI4PM_03500 [Butyricicoccus sp.]